MKFNSIFKEFPVINTERLILRQLREGDAEELFNYFSDKEVYKYTDWYGPKSVEHAKKIIDAWNSGYEEGWIIRFAIEDKNTNKIIGTVFFTEFDEYNKRAEIGYDLSRKYWRQGIMSEVFENILPLAYEKFDLIRVQALIREENIPSQLLAKKFGFKEEGLLRKFECHSVEKVYNDMLLFALVK